MLDGDTLATMPVAEKNRTAGQSSGHDSPPTRSAFAAAALERECGRVACAAEGERNDTLNRAGFALGQLVAGGELHHVAVADALLRAARGCGLPDTEAEKTIASGMKAGAAEPRRAPEPDRRRRDDSLPPEAYRDDEGVVYDESETDCPAPDDAAAEPPRLRTLGELLPDAIELARRRRAGDEKPVPLPWPEYAAALGDGLWPGMHVVVASTAMGKTALALLVALGAVKVGVPVAYVGLELDDAQVSLRVLAEDLRVRWSDLYLGHCHPDLLDRAQARAAEMTGFPFYVETGPPGGWAPSNLYTLAATMRAQHPSGPMLLVVDFLQLVGPEHDGGRVELRERISRAAYVGRDVARRHGVSVLLICSTARDKYAILNSDLKAAGLATRRGRHGTDKVILNPGLLVGLGKESGDIEFAADTSTVLTRWPAPLDNGDSVYILATPKVRYGPERWMALSFGGGRFAPLPIETVDDLPEAPGRGGRPKVGDDELEARLLATVRSERPATRREGLAATDGDMRRLGKLWSALTKDGRIAKVDGRYEVK